ncbi:MAG: response regulator transcription factor [Melioribacteraceae bacterium]
MSSENKNNSRKKLLIVDDSAEIRKGLKRFISEIKNIDIVGEAGDAVSALGLVEKLNPDFVTLDIKMPGEGGIIALMEIKKRFPQIVVLMLTNFPFDHYRKICQNAGADYFFDKSHEFEEMVGTIKLLADG